MPRLGFALALLTALILGGCSFGGDQVTTSTVPIPPEATASAPVLAPGADGCNHKVPPVVQDRQTFSEAPPSPLVGSGPWIVTMTTSCGSIVIELDTKTGGEATDAFAALARTGFYDGLKFHRVVPGFVIQGGDPQGDGSGGPGFSVQAPPPSDYAYRNGDVAMAKASSELSGTAGSQFFIVSTESGAAMLEPLYAVVGHVVDAESTSTLRRIDVLGIDNGPPVEPVYIWAARLTDAK